MPKRTDEERLLIDSLPKKKADKFCNARTPNNETGYCRLSAGYGTDHPGKGRCKFHGGRAGAPIIHGMYSRKLPSTIRKEFDKLIENPELVNLTTELALIKTLLSNLLKNIEERLNDSDRNWWVQMTKKGKDISAEAKALLKVLEAISKIYSRIQATEGKVLNQLTIKDVQIIVNQIKVSMNSVCGSCPIRGSIIDKMNTVKIQEVVSDANVVNESPIKQINK